jgi:hypothetical protein
VHHLVVEDIPAMLILPSEVNRENTEIWMKIRKLTEHFVNNNNLLRFIKIFTFRFLKPKTYETQNTVFYNYSIYFRTCSSDG